MFTGAPTQTDVFRSLPVVDDDFAERAAAYLHLRGLDESRIRQALVDELDITVTKAEEVASELLAA